MNKKLAEDEVDDEEYESSEPEYLDSDDEDEDSAANQKRDEDWFDKFHKKRAKDLR